MYPPVIKVPETSATEIAKALAELSGFGKVYSERTWETSYGGRGQRDISHIYHRNRSPQAFAAEERPDILVTQLDIDQYLVEYTAKVESRLLKNPEATLRQFRADQQPVQPVA